MQVAESTNEFGYFRIFKGITQHAAISIQISFILVSIEFGKFQDAEKVERKRGIMENIIRRVTTPTRRNLT